MRINNSLFSFAILKRLAISNISIKTLFARSKTMEKDAKSNLDKLFVIESLKACIPNEKTRHKGQAGRIGIIGGSLEYSGAPYFAGISALRAGADLVHIFCEHSAATPIKCYSPELIVHPLLDSINAVASITPWLERLHSIVIGPGLGREAATFKVVADFIGVIKEKKIPLVIDADGLFLVTENLDLIKDFNSPVVLTPNEIEYQRLCNKTGGLSGMRELGSNITILRKGCEDELISNHKVQWKSIEGGSSRRCGGQGDLLSGSIATFLHWTMSNQDNLKVDVDKAALAASISCYAACSIVRKCNEKAYKEMGLGMLASDMINYIHESFDDFMTK